MTQVESTPQTTARWLRRKEARPAEILDAAVAVFAEKGFAAARMEDIAKRAGVTKGTIYLYFQGKEDVFKTLVRTSIGTTLETVRSVVDAYDGASADLIRIALRTIVNFLCTSDRVVLPKIVLAEAGNFPELARFHREEVIDKGLALLSGVIARGIERGEFRELNPGYVARLCIAPVLLSILWRTTFAQFDATPFDHEAFIETHIDVLLKGLAADGVRS